MPAALPLAMVGSAGASLASGIIGAGAANKAANLQYNATQDALKTQQLEFQYAQNQLLPFVQTGQGAANELGALTGISTATGMPDYSKFYNSPDFGFAQQQGNLGVSRYEAANGMNLSGGALKDIATFNSGLASQQYGNYFNRLMSLATLGNSAASSGAQLASNAGNVMGNTQMAGGANLASGVVGGANAWTSALSHFANAGVTGASLYNQQNQLSQNQLMLSMLLKNPSSYGNPTSLGSAGPGSGDSFKLSS
jgi:hypothetical protein